MADPIPLRFHEEAGHEFPAVVTITLQTTVESEDEFQDFLANAREAMQKQGRWSVGQGEHPIYRPEGIAHDEAQVKLNWSILRLDRWRKNNEKESE